MSNRGFYRLLNCDRNAKTVKGQKQGYATAVLFLAPYKAAGFNVCPMAEQAGCAAACLNTSGRGGIATSTFSPHGYELPDNKIQRARIARTRFFIEDRDAFMAELIKEIGLFIKRSEKNGLIPVVRLNGTSDIIWEKIPVRSEYPVEAFGATIFDVYPDIQFYDYTKIAKRFEWPRPDNYHLTLSYSEATPRYKSLCWTAYKEHDAPLVMVVRDKALKAQCLKRDDAIDGDLHDLRFLDPEGCIVYLIAKGPARHDQTGFVLD